MVSNIDFIQLLILGKKLLFEIKTLQYLEVTVFHYKELQKKSMEGGAFSTKQFNGHSCFVGQNTILLLLMINVQWKKPMKKVLLIKLLYLWRVFVDSRHVLLSLGNAVWLCRPVRSKYSHTLIFCYPGKDLKQPHNYT